MFTTPDIYDERKFGLIHATAALGDLGIVLRLGQDPEYLVTTMTLQTWLYVIELKAHWRISS